MNNQITFKYNGKIWNPKNPEKKLKQLGITWDDVEIIEDSPKEEKQIKMNDIQMYHFKNLKTGHTLVSIYPELGDYIEDKENWTFVKTTSNGL